MIVFVCFARKSVTYVDSPLSVNFNLFMVVYCSLVTRTLETRTAPGSSFRTVQDRPMDRARMITLGSP